MNVIQEYLRKNNVAFDELHHEPVGDPVLYSRQNGTRLSQQAKALLLRCKDKKGNKSYIVVTLPAYKQLDFNVLRKLVPGTKSVNLAEEEVMKTLTGCSYGELPPVARLWGLQLYMDKQLLAEPRIYFNAAQLDYSIIAAPEAIVGLENPVLF